ncbi:MAG: acetolactate synthase small subunit [Leptospiraceae bacterium]|nr:acetolactate synthase small subunit [Leptospiraceae bacterium]MDW7975320.1 acetolactate synthase small subunit [Leptospiraceae bacterium]
MKHILSITVRNKPGVMSHVSGLFTRRGFNIDSIAVGETPNPEISVITIVMMGDENTANQLKGQLLKLADVLDVRILNYSQAVIRELILLRIKVMPDKRSEFFGIIEIFNGKIHEIHENTILIEVQGNPRQINSLFKVLSEYEILEIARTGQIALPMYTE